MTIMTNPSDDTARALVGSTNPEEAGLNLEIGKAHDTFCIASRDTSPK
jgi:hypothetical protein